MQMVPLSARLYTTFEHCQRPHHSFRNNDVYLLQHQFPRESTSLTQSPILSFPLIPYAGRTQMQLSGYPLFRSIAIASIVNDSGPETTAMVPG